MNLKPELEAEYLAMKKTNHDQGAEEDKQLFRFAERWAEAMEKVIAEKIKMPEFDNAYGITMIIADCADDLAGKADVKTDRITRKVYGWAVAVLAKHWVYGEELRIWHNLTTEIKDEGKEANKIPGKVLDTMNVNVTVKK